MNLGDVVRFEMPGEAGWEALVLGEMSYSEDGDVLLLGDGKALGMPCNKQWCTWIGMRDLLAAERQRRKYTRRYPGTLKPNAGLSGGPSTNQNDAGGSSGPSA